MPPTAVTARRFSRVDLAAVASLTTLAFIVRVWGIGRPLWFDELWTYRLGVLGAAAMLDNAWIDQTPPLYFLVQHASTGFGALQGEIAMRWLSLAAGTLVVPLVWLVSARWTGRRGATAMALLTAASPTLVYYSQEARGYSLLLFVACLTLLLMAHLINGKPDKKTWALWAAASVVGVHLGYAYLMVAVTQAAFLSFLHFRTRAFRVCLVAVAAGILPLAPMAWSGLSVRIARAVNEPITTPWWEAQMLLAGDPNRYGFTLSHAFAPLLCLGLAVIGAWFTTRRDRRLAAYAIAQTTLPFVLFYGVISPLFSIYLPTVEAMQFLPVLPAGFALVAAGFARLDSGLRGRALGCVVWLALLALNGVGLQRFYQDSRSPEALTAIAVRDQRSGAEPVVSAHYALNFAAGYYLSPSTPLFVSPRPQSDEFRFRSLTAGEFFRRSSSPADLASAQIRALPRFWVMYHAQDAGAIDAALASGCRVTSRAMFPPFEAIRLEDCTA